MKKSGKIKFAGLSCHDKGLAEVIEAAAECGWIDQIMIQYNYRTMDIEQIKRAVDKASKAKLGLVAMKTQAGAGSFDEKGTRPASRSSSPRDSRRSRPPSRPCSPTNGSTSS